MGVIRLEFYSNIVLFLFMLLEFILAVYVLIQIRARNISPKNFVPVIVLTLLLLYNTSIGWFFDLLRSVFVNLITLTIVVLIMILTVLKLQKKNKSIKCTQFLDRRNSYFIFGLSAREIQVVELVKKGYGNGKIANELHISKRTVEGHIQNIFDKVGCERNRLALIWKLSE